MPTKPEILEREILKLSTGTSWAEALGEWGLRSIHFVEGQTCVCTHFPIKEVCVIENKGKGITVEVGNCCVKNFMGLPSDKLFGATKRIAKDNAKSANKETLDHALGKGFISQWDYDFYIDTLRKRKLSEKQLQARQRINDAISRNIARSPAPKPIKKALPV